MQGVLMGVHESKRLLLDTNIYGILFTDSGNAWIPASIREKDFVVCGSSVIREELRDISKAAKVKNEKLRKLTFVLYDSFVPEKRNYSVTEFVERLAEKYSENYSGTHSFQELKNDFLIIATASLHNVDIVVSNDEKTMTSQKAVESYKTVNARFELRTPNFIKLDGLKQLLKQSL